MGDPMAKMDIRTSGATINMPRIGGELLHPFAQHVLMHIQIPLYPKGDIRAKIILEQITLPAVFADILAAARDAGQGEPNVDFVLAAACAAHAPATWGLSGPQSGSCRW